MKPLLFGLLTLLFAVQVQAQSPANSEVSDSRVDRLTKKMIDELALSEEQVTGIEMLNDELEKEIEGIKELQKTDLEAFKSQRRTLVKSHHESVVGLLNAEQAKQYREHIKLRRSARKARNSHKKRIHEQHKSEKKRLHEQHKGG